MNWTKQMIFDDIKDYRKAIYKVGGEAYRYDYSTYMSEFYKEEQAAYKLIKSAKISMKKADLEVIQESLRLTYNKGLLIPCRPKKGGN